MVDFAEMAEIAASGLFDGVFYASQLDEVPATGFDGLRHFCEDGWKRGLRPNAFFDAHAYLQEHADVARSRLNPLVHYIRHGEREGRRPVQIFDPAWYRATYQPSQLALSHFLYNTKAGLVLPSPEAFAFARVNGLSTRELPPSADALRQLECQLIRESGLVDQDYYLLNGEDVYDAGIEAPYHYSIWGWREHRKPNICFDTDWYLRTNPEVRRLGLNPLAHYILAGERSGRRPAPWFDPLWYRERYSVPDRVSALRHYLENRRTRSVSPTPLFDAEWFVARDLAKAAKIQDPFAYYLQSSGCNDLAPSPSFDAAAYRRTHMGRPSRHFATRSEPNLHHPLIHKSLHDYLGRKQVS